MVAHLTWGVHVIQFSWHVPIVCVPFDSLDFALVLCCSLSLIIKTLQNFFGLAYYQCKDVVFIFFVKYSSLRDFGP
jgi:hypothetical protein